MLLLFEQPKRLLEEHRELLALAIEVDWLHNIQWTMSNTSEVCFDFDIVVGDRTYEGTLTFPGLYPDAPPYVRPRVPGERWSIHQYPDTGTLCLEWGPDNWRPDITTADLIRSTHRLLMAETTADPYAAVPSRHSVTLGQRLRGKSHRLYVPPGIRQALLATRPHRMVSLKGNTTIRFLDFVSFIGEINGVAIANGSSMLPAEPASDLLGGWLPREGWVMHCDEFASLPEKCTATHAKDFLTSKGFDPAWDEVKVFAWLAVLVDAQNRIRSFTVPLDDSSTISAYTLFGTEQSVGHRIPEGYGALSGKSIGIVGLGSLGSKIAVSLARSGVTSFVLVDEDIFLPENLCRHQLDWLSVGFSKAEAVKGAIKLVQPTAVVSSRVVQVAAQESASSNSALLEAISGCDLIVDATANPRALTALAAMCRRRQRTLVWGEVFAGGIGGLMARSIPKRDADPLTVRAAVHAYLATLPDAPFKLEGGYDVPQENAPPLVAGDAEVGAVAASMTAFAIDALTGGNQPRFPVAAYLFGFSNAWEAFSAPFHTHAIKCPPANDTAQEGIDESLAALKVLATVIKIRPQEDDSASSS